MQEKNYQHLETAFIHGGVYADEQTGAVNVPIYQTSTFAQPELGVNTGWEYSRTGNPTRAALESLIAELEGGCAGFAFASGMAAITAALSLFKSGDTVLLGNDVYGGTFRVLDKVFNNFGIGYRLVDTGNLAALAQQMTADVKAIMLESPANPLLTVCDIAAVAELARSKGILTIVDNTFMTPYLQRPLALGADIVIHSATKYLGGHSDLVAGLLVVNNEELAERTAFIQNATGGVLGPQDSFLLIRGIKTLAVRMDRHVANAETLAAGLGGHQAVQKLFYPWLPYAAGYDLQRRQAKNGGAMFSFELREDYDVRRFLAALRLITLAESLGGVESLVCHPASMTHASIPAAVRRKLGITDNLIRLSTGIENVQDLQNDLEQALRKSKID